MYFKCAFDFWEKTAFFCCPVWYIKQAKPSGWHFGNWEWGARKKNEQKSQWKLVNPLWRGGAYRAHTLLGWALLGVCVCVCLYSSHHTVHIIIK